MAAWWWVRLAVNCASAFFYRHPIIMAEEAA